MDTHESTVPTKLLNIRTLKLEEFADIENLPPYAAISHVWSEQFFLTESHASITYEHPEGMKMLNIAFQSELLRHVDYCWIDTWCIDQSDESDKLRQIPKMASVYRNSVCVPILVKHVFSFSQRDWDRLIISLNDDLEWYKARTLQSPNAHERCKEICNRDESLKLLGYVAEIAELPWNSRIWTAQEYVSSQASFWVDGEGKIVMVDSEHIMILIGMVKVGRYEGKVGHMFSVKGMILNNLFMAVALRKDRSANFIAIAQSQSRQCEREVDQIYALMGLTTVSIQPFADETLESAWERWWSAAISAGQMELALMPVVLPEVGASLPIRQNCIMPPCELRCASLGASMIEYMNSVGLSAFEKGTITAWGRNEGECIVDFHLGTVTRVDSNASASPRFSLAGKSFCQLYREHPEVMRRLLNVFLGLCGTRSDLAVIIAKLNDLVLNNNGMSDNSEPRISESVDVVVMNWLNTLWFLCGPNQRLYLSILKTESQVADLLFSSAEDIPAGKHLALDLGCLSSKTSQRQTNLKPLMIVHQQGDGDSLDSPLHKVGMAFPLYFATSQAIYQELQTDFPLIWSPNVEFEQFSVGGSLCAYCQSCRNGVNKTLQLPSL